MTHFSGSYKQSDVMFLLKQVDVQHMDVEEKERFIQNGGGHYSQVLTREKAPLPAYMGLFAQSMENNSDRMAEDVLNLARSIDSMTAGRIAVVSLARAGTPVGVLAHRTLNGLLNRASEHYSVSIIRDVGLDLNALAYIRKHHKDEDIVFVDGWTGKGVIGRTLRESIKKFNAENGASVRPFLHVLADISGTADFSASTEDYLLPSAVLNSTVSGLVSRTVVNEQIGPEDFHGCMFYRELEHADISRYFVDALYLKVEYAHAATLKISRQACNGDPQALAAALSTYAQAYGVPDINLLKPGVGEATRVMLRRNPRLLVVKDRSNADVKHLIALAWMNNITIVDDPQLPCNALAIIAKAD